MAYGKWSVYVVIYPLLATLLVELRFHLAADRLRCTSLVRSVRLFVLDRMPRPKVPTLRFSLRSAFMLLTLGCLVGGYYVNSMRLEDQAMRQLRQREFTVAFHAEPGAGMYYDEKQDKWVQQPPLGAKWLRSLFGDCVIDHVKCVAGVNFSNRQENVDRYRDDDLKLWRSDKLTHRSVGQFI